MAVRSNTTDTAKQYTDFVQQGQEATLKAVETWSRTVQDAFTQAPGLGRVDVQSAVDSAYDLAAKLLDVQRSYVQSLLAHAVEAVDTTTAWTKRVAADN
jgi:uncharacterized protein (DUF305 family)